MSRLTDENKEIISLLGNNESYWLSIYFKLKEYEDLEEQGLLLKLPCKFGDTYFRILYGEIYENEFNNRATIVSMLDDGAFGKTVFLTKEEAEQGLKRMEGAE